MKRIGIDSQPDLSPAVQELLEGFADGMPQAVTAREKRLGVAAAVTFVAAAVTLAALLPAERPFEPLTAAVLAVAFALAKQVKFEVGIGYALPTQLAFVPMLLLLPAGSVPLVVLAGMVLGFLPGWLRRRAHISRLLLAPGDCWYAIGPALVIGLVGPASKTGPCCSARSPPSSGSTSLRERSRTGSRSASGRSSASG
jgi:hypothetical protein